MTKVLPVLVLLAISVLILIFSPFLKIKSVKVNSNQSCLAVQNLQDFQIIGENILFLSEKNLEETLKNKFSCASDIKIEKSLPSTVTLEIIKKQPVAKIEGKNLSLLEDGLVEEQVLTDKIPVFYPPANSVFQSGQKITDETSLFALKIASLLAKSDFTVTSIRIINSEEIALYDSQGKVAVFSAAKPADSQVDSLQQVLAQAKIDASKITKIDLRFDKPVIK